MASNGSSIILPKKEPRYSKFIIMSILNNIEELQDSIDVMEKERSELINHNEHLLTSVDVLSKENDQLKMENKNLQKTIDKLLEKIDDYESNALERGEKD